MRFHVIVYVLLASSLLAGTANGQTFEQVRDDQINRLRTYVLDAILPSGLVRDSLVLSGNSFHPATPDAAGFALLALSALDHLGKLPDAEARVANVLSTYAGHKPGVSPDRSIDGHFIHFMNIQTGAPAGGGWDDSYSPISSALLVAGAQFAANHFTDSPTIASLAQELTDSVDFNAAVRVDGRIYLDMTKQGGGAGGTVRPWNEFMLVESLALREVENLRSQAVKHLWLNPENIPKAVFQSHPMLTDGGFPPAFWVHQMHFFNGDFRHNAEFEQFFTNHQLADQAYSSLVLNEDFRYGLTAGVIPNGYHADAIQNHPETVFSPEAVAAWGDFETLLEFYDEQDPDSDARYRYGMVRVSAEQPNWVPFDAGLVDHLFLLFGLVESVDPRFFEDRMLPGLIAGDYNSDEAVNAADYTVWRDALHLSTDLRADGNLNGLLDVGDYDVWKLGFSQQLRRAGLLTTAAIPEPLTSQLLLAAILILVCVSSRRPATSGASRQT